jgi:hypothetical protein
VHSATTTAAFFRVAQHFYAVRKRILCQENKIGLGWSEIIGSLNFQFSKKSKN